MSSVHKRASREERKRQAELDELRKTGAVPPELDDEGNMINPHIPEYISQAPWYLYEDKPGLKHQRADSYLRPRDPYTNTLPLDQRGAKKRLVQRATRYRKGACTNCGSMTHKRKDCVERPRKRGAKLTNSNIAPDEEFTEGERSFAAKRDRWANYDVREYKKVIQLHERAEAERRRRKAAEVEKRMAARAQQREGQGAGQSDSAGDATDTSTTAGAAGGTGDAATAAGDALMAGRGPVKRRKTGEDGPVAVWESDSEDDAGDDGMRYTGDEERDDKGSIHTKRDARTRMTVRNLRIREDTPKYLLNLDQDSAYYDPKTRSMRGNPFPDKAPEDLAYAGDNFVNTSGDVSEIRDMQLFTVEAQKRGKEGVNMLALPSRAALLYKQYKERTQKLKQHTSNALMAKYQDQAQGSGAAVVVGEKRGRAGASVPQDRRLLMGESASYTEYDRYGRVVRQTAKLVPSSRYEEDVTPGTHTQVWGSYYDLSSGQWGYGCCRTMDRANMQCSAQ